MYSVKLTASCLSAFPLSTASSMRALAVKVNTVQTQGANLWHTRQEQGRILHGRRKHLPFLRIPLDDQDQTRSSIRPHAKQSRNHVIWCRWRKGDYGCSTWQWARSLSLRQSCMLRVLFHTGEHDRKHYLSTRIQNQLITVSQIREATERKRRTVFSVGHCSVVNV